MKARKDMARRRGELYLEYAKRYLAEGQVNQALATANEGIHLAGGQCYLAVQEQLEDLKRHILANDQVHPLLQETAP